MAIALKGGKTQLLCRICDADPLKSLKIYEMVTAARPPKDGGKRS